jgi:hypothetical protein
MTYPKLELGGPGLSCLFTGKTLGLLHCLVLNNTAGGSLRTRVGPVVGCRSFIQPAALSWAG